jgi:hypothetical protein
LQEYYLTPPPSSYGFLATFSIPNNSDLLTKTI